MCRPDGDAVTYSKGEVRRAPVTKTESHPPPYTRRMSAIVSIVLPRTA